MKRSISVWQFVGFSVTSIFGTMLHFLYDWTNQSIIAAPFSATNESTWEHMKLLFFPMFIFALIESRFFSKDHENFWCIKLKGIVLGLILIPVLFYTYNGIFGTSPDWINIAIFFVSAAAAYIFETKLFKRHGSRCRYSAVSLTVLYLIALAFVVLTFVQPQIPLFQDPITKGYGLTA